METRKRHSRAPSSRGKRVSADNDKKNGDRLGLLYEIAHMYYVLDMSQSEIAKRTFLSRPHISRLLKQAKQEGIVEIKLNYMGERCRYAETAIRAEYGLDEVCVYNCARLGPDEVGAAISRHSATHVESVLHAGQMVGITRGSIIANMIAAFKGGRKLDLRIMQMMGAEATDPHQNSAADLIRKMADIFGGTATYIDAPLYVENDYVRNSLIQEPFLRKKLNDIRGVELVVTSIRPLLKGMTNHVWTGFIDAEQLEEIIDAGGVGYLLGRPFDKDGALLDHPVNQRIVGMDPRELRDKKVIGIAYGAECARGVLGALRGKYLTTLIVDSECANEILSLGG